MSNLVVGHYGYVSILCNYVNNQLFTVCAYDHELCYQYRVDSKDFESFKWESFPGLTELVMMDIIKYHEINDVVMDTDQLVSIMSNHIKSNDINFAYFALTNDNHSFIMYGHDDLCNVTFFDNDLNIGVTFKRVGVLIEFPTYAANVSHIAIPLLKLSDEECFNTTKVYNIIKSVVGSTTLIV